MGICLAQEVLDFGANINESSKDSWTPLHAAIWKSAEDVSQYLLDNGADVDAETKDGSTPFHVATQPGHSKILKALLERLTVS